MQYAATFIMKKTMLTETHRNLHNPHSESDSEGTTDPK